MSRPSKLPYPPLPGMMTKKQVETLSADFNHCFAGAENPDAEDLFYWAQNTADFYNWFYTRFERRALGMCNYSAASVLHPDYIPDFLEFTPYEMASVSYADFLRRLKYHNKLTKVSETDIHVAAKMVYRYYFGLFKEAHPTVDFNQYVSKDLMDFWIREQRVIPATALIKE